MWKRWNSINLNHSYPKKYRPDRLPMFQKSFLLFFPIYGLILFSPISAQRYLRFKWSVAAELPSVDSTKKPGVAGAFSGIHNNILLIAGGANFPDGMPWEGGRKVYWDNIYALELNHRFEFRWIDSEMFKLQQRIAYGASVSSDDGIICMGGENENGISKNVFLLQWNSLSRNVLVNDLPELPLPLANASAAAIGSRIYVAGGETLNGVSDKFYFLDLSDTSSGWKQLPQLPKPLSHAVLLAKADGKNNRIYLIGGRRKKTDGISELSKSVFEFDVRKHHWTEKKSLPYALSAGTGIVSGSGDLLLFGGDKGETFHKTEVLLAAINAENDETKKQELIQQKNKLQQSHSGFSNEVLLYNAKRNKWKVIGEMPAPTPVTTAAVKWKNSVVIPSGEIRAGVRTPAVLIGTYNKKKK